MTTIKRKLVRRTDSVDPCYSERIVIELGPKMLCVRAKGRRTRHAVPYQEIWRLAMKLRLVGIGN